MVRLIKRVYYLIFFPEKLVKLSQKHTPEVSIEQLKESINLVRANIFRAFGITRLTAELSILSFLVLSFLTCSPGHVILGALRFFGYIFILWGVFSPTGWKIRTCSGETLPEILDEEWHRLAYGTGLYCLLLSYLFEIFGNSVSGRVIDNFSKIGVGMDWNALISALIGGGLSLLGAVVAVFIQGNMKKNDEQFKEKILIRGFIQSIKTEIITLWDGYSNGVGKEIESIKEGAPFLSTYPITHDYFTVYTTSAFLIGRVEQEDLRKAIVVTYTQARTLIDSYRMNNDLIREMRQLEYTSVHSGSTNLSNHIRLKLDELVRYAPKILALHNGTKENVKGLLVLIEKYKT